MMLPCASVQASWAKRLRTENGVLNAVRILGGVFVIMEEIIFRVAQRDDYRELAEWLVRVSQAPEQHCLHTWSGEGAGELQQQLQGYWDDSELCYVLALRDGQLAGAMGCEYDEELGRGWLHGPHVATEDWRPVAAALFARLLVALPACIGQLHAFLNVENKRGRRFYAQQGFVEREHLNYEFWLAPDERVVSDDGGCFPISKEQEASFKQLYEALFPRAYYSADRVLEMIGQSHQVFVTDRGGAGPGICRGGRGGGPVGRGPVPGRARGLPGARAMAGDCCCRRWTGSWICRCVTGLAERW